MAMQRHHQIDPFNNCDLRILPGGIRNFVQAVTTTPIQETVTFGRKMSIQLIA